MKLIDILVEDGLNGWRWPEGAEKATSYSHIPGVHFWDCDGLRVDYSDLTTRELGCEEVTREQYESALAAKNEGWIEWSGGKCPVQTGVLVDVRYGDGVEEFALEANTPNKTRFRTAAAAWWRKDGSSGDIIAYRLHQPRQTEQPEASEEDLNECIGQAPSAVCSGEWLPSAGCECEYQYKVHGSEWCSFECVAIDGNAAFGWSNNTPIALQLNTHNFRPMRSEADRKRHKAAQALCDAGGGFGMVDEKSWHGSSWFDIYNAIAAGKIPGVKLED